MNTAQQTINGKLVTASRVFEEGNFWRWQIVDENGTQYADGGNFKTREAAEASLLNAFDPE